MAEVTYLEAIRAAMADAMRDDERVFLIGEDVGHFGGPFGVSKGLLEEFGEERVIDTPIAEEGFVGAAFGAAWMGERPIAELQFADFISCAFDPIVTVGAKTHWRSGIKLPVVIRSPFGGGCAAGRSTRAAPRGSSSARPASRSCARAASRTPTGSCAARSRTTTRCSTSSTRRSTAACAPRRPETSLRTPIGRAQIARRGTDVTLIAYGAMVDVALRAADALAGEASVEVLDLRTVWPLDERRDPRARSRAPRASACCRRRARRSAPPGRCSR